MKILAIDTTGYRTSVAIVNDNRVLDERSIFSPIFAPSGGNLNDVFNTLPQLHQKFILTLVGESLEKVKLDWDDIDAISVSAYSGIYHCVLVGLATASALSQFHKKPLIIVDHLLAHSYSCWIERDPREFHFPILIFSASGNHSGFFLITGLNECKVLYDRVPEEISGNAKTFTGIGKLFNLLGLKLRVIFSPDSEIKKLINLMSKGNPHKFNFVSAYRGGLFDFDFSGLMLMVDNLKWKYEKEFKIGSSFIRDVAASFQESVCEILTRKIIEAVEITKAKEIHINGGISENECLKRKLKEKISAQGGSAFSGKRKKTGFVLRYPLKKEYGLDNAAMIGALAYYQQKYRIKFVNFRPQISH